MIKTLNQIFFHHPTKIRIFLEKTPPPTCFQVKLSFPYCIIIVMIGQSCMVSNQEHDIGQWPMLWTIIPPPFLSSFLYQLKPFKAKFSKLFYNFHFEEFSVHQLAFKISYELIPFLLKKSNLLDKIRQDITRERLTYARF